MRRRSALAAGLVAAGLCVLWLTLPDRVALDRRAHAQGAPGEAFQFADDFSDPSSGWAVVDHPLQRLEYLDGEYRILLPEPGYHTWSTTLRMPAFASFIAEVDARAVSEEPGVEYGFFFGARHSEDLYYFGVDPALRSYTMRRRQPGGWLTIVAPRPSTAIEPGGGRNRLGVEHRESMVTLYVNGERLTRVRQEGIPADRVYLMVNNSAAPGGADVRFDDISVRGDALPTVTSTPTDTEPATPSPTATTTPELLATEPPSPATPTHTATAAPPPSPTATAPTSTEPAPSRLYLPSLRNGN
jgi:hypothetical protein